MSAVSQSSHASVQRASGRLSARTRRSIVRLTIIYVCTTILALFAALPMVWMFSTAVKPRAEVFREPTTIIPSNATWDNFIRVVQPTSTSGRYFGTYFLNSTIVSVSSAFLSVVVAAPAAYAFSRFRFPGKSPAYFAVLARNMFPLIVFLVPLFSLMTSLRLTNTYPGLILAYLTFTLPLSIWLLKGFFDAIPPELERAARIDGCTRFGAFIRVILPLTTPGLAATAIYSFIQAWNEFPYALNLAYSTQMRTLPVGMTFFFSENQSDWTGLMATAVIISIPVVIIFMILQRYFISALTQGAVKA
ncbi:MAG: carbohydrate ABC transporter permease [Anaerolineae bacterium]|nr:carbohydrate ABC transporter permease [Anaerolineae bacterium]